MVDRLARWAFYGLLIWLILIPLGSQLQLAFQDQNVSSLASTIWIDLQSDVTKRTGLLAALIAWFSTVLGTLIAWRMGFSNGRPPKVVTFSLLIPLILPPYLIGIAWTSVAGLWIYNFWGCVALLTACWTPLCVFMMYRAFLSCNPHIFDLAELDGIPLRRRFWTIDVPLVFPVLLSSFLLLFVLNLSEFGVPSLLNVPVMTFEVFTEYSAFYDDNAAVVKSFPILAIAVCGLIFERVVRRGEPIHILDARQSGRLLTRNSRSISGAAIYGLCLINGFFPLALLVYQTGRQHFFQSVGQAFLLIDSAILPSLYIAECGAVGLTGAGFLLALFVDKRIHETQITWPSMLVETLVMLLLAIPPAIWALALLKYWNQPENWKQAVADSFFIIVIGYLGRFLPIPYRICRDGVDSIQSAYIETARLDGASIGRLYGQILLPLLLPVLITAFVISFIFCFGELSITLFCAPPGTATLPVRLYTIMANSPSSIISATALFLIIVCTPLVWIAFHFGAATFGTQAKELQS